jgi:ferric-dicitrate binding protein FerR (iron transport regulator)
MKHIIALIQKIKDGAATPADVTLLEAMLEREEDTTLRQSLQEAFDRAVATGERALTPEKSASMLMQLHNKMEEQAARIRPVRMRSRLLPYAAAVAGLMLLSGLTAMYIHLQKKGRNSIAIAQQHMKFIRNTTAKTVTITLPEGSLITMEPGAALLYADSAVRNITLRGKAVFNVKANRNNPFTVYAGNTVTMALGTLFTVDAQYPQMVTVKLETGKVLVRTKDGTTKEDIYLLPGEEFHFDKALHQYSVAKASAGAAQHTKGSAADTKHAVLMAFNNAPLDSVLNKLETAFGISILYEHSDVDGAYFTGQVLKTDSLQNMLEVICQLNNLELIPGEGSMSIRKIR